MGKREKKIVGKNLAKIIEVPKSTYSDEMQAFHRFCNVDINMERIGLVTCTALKTPTTGELAHAELFADRISQLGNNSPRSPEGWENV